MVVNSVDETADQVSSETDTDPEALVGLVVPDKGNMEQKVELTPHGAMNCETQFQEHGWWSCQVVFTYINTLSISDRACFEKNETRKVADVNLPASPRGWFSFSQRAART